MSESRLDPSLLLEDVNIKEEVEDKSGVLVEQTEDLNELDTDDDDPEFELDKESLAKRQKKRKTTCAKDGDPDKEYQCYKCGEILVGLEHIKDHQRREHGWVKVSTYGDPRQFQCSECKSMFETEEKMEWHYCKNFKGTKVPGKDYFECDLCSERFYRHEHYSAHRIFHTQEKKFSCHQCDYKAKNPFFLAKHKNRVHNRNYSHVCDLCGKSFITKFEMQIHVRRTHFADRKDFICEECGQGYADSQSLNKHKRSEHPTFFMCTLCEKICTKARDLKHHLHFEHSVVSSNKLVPICPLCRQECSSIVAFNDHMESYHNVESCFPCKKCDMSFATRSILKLHMIDAHKLNPLKCSPEEAELFDVVAIKSSLSLPPSISGFKRHSTGQYKCDQCEKAFSAKRTLNCHKKQVHDKTSHIQCPQCEFTTYLPSLVNKHVREKHQRVYSFQCQQCSFRSWCQSKLNTHIRDVHDKVKPHKCPDANCDKAFRAPKRLAMHMLREHNLVMKK